MYCGMIYGKTIITIITIITTIITIRTRITIIMGRETVEAVAAAEILMAQL
jgi:hypothetical protein